MAAATSQSCAEAVGDAAVRQCSLAAFGDRQAEWARERYFGVMCKRYYHCFHSCMTTRKQRLTVTVDPDLVEAGTRAVAEGKAESLSGWVSSALAEKVRRDQQLAHLRAAIGDYEAEFGEITADEIAAQQRADREDAIVVRGRRPAGGGRTRKARSA